MIFFTAINFDSFKKRTIDADSKFASQSSKTTAGTAVGNYIYEKTMKYLYKTLGAIKTDSKNPATKNYFLSIEKTLGDYSKRDTKTYSRVTSMVSFCRTYVEDKENKDMYPDLENSTLGVYVKMFDILSSGSYTSMFKKAYSYANEVGDMNTSVTVFKTIYTCLVFAIEITTAHMAEFEIEIYTGKTPDKAILDVMTKHASFTKNVIYSIITILGYLHSLKNPSQTVTECISHEKEMKKKLETKEAEEIVADSDAANTPDEIMPTFNKDQIDTEAELESDKHDALYEGDVTKSNEFLGGVFAVVPVLQISLWVLGITAAILIIPTIRLVIYWFKTMKIDGAKELELKAEILDNNIVVLKQKLNVTKDEKERARLTSIIEKQEKYVAQFYASSQKELADTEYETGEIVEDDITTEDNRKEIEDDKDNNFEIVL
jgi:hypothetical protein